mgnify:CR=1 FL=1
MSEKEKTRAESLGKVTDSLTDEQLQRLSDIAYGMMLAQESKQNERKEA